MMLKLFKIIVPLMLSLVTTLSFGLNKDLALFEITEPAPFTIETIGEGKPILYLPGFATPGDVWKDTVEHLQLNRKSYLFSYAGFNGNTPIAMPWYATIKKAIIAYVTENNLSDVIIISHSMGGNLAVDIAAELPDAISKIIIVEALPCMREVMMPGVPAEQFYYESPYNTQMLDMDTEQFKSMATMMASNMTFNEDKKELITNWMIHADRETWVYGYTDLLKLDLRPALSEVKCETLILGASFPNATVAEVNYNTQYANLVNKTLLMATDSKHFLMFDQPEWFYESVTDFLVHGTK